MTPLSRKRLAQIIAQSLCLCAWDQPSIASCLDRRLPAALRRFVKMQTLELCDLFPTRLAPSHKTLAASLAQSLIFERIYLYCVKHNSWPAPDLQSPRMQPLPALAAIDIPQLATLSDLADWLMLTPDHLTYYADPCGRHAAHGDMAVNHYHSHISAKSSGGLRLIEAPKPRLKSLQRVILSAILNHVPPHPNAYGFIKGRNCIDAAARHAGEDVVIACDLRDFFPSIHAGRISGIFRALGYPPNVARTLTSLCTVKTPAQVINQMPVDQRQILRAAHLPQGAPTSPALANLAARSLDRRLTGLVRSLGATYTRYADDLSFSGDNHIRRAILDAVPKIVTQEGFSLNAAKTRVMPSHRRQVVTGIVVNAKTNVDRRDYDRLKAIIHARHWQYDPITYAQVTGQIGWVAQLNPAKGARLRELLAGQGADA